MLLIYLLTVSSSLIAACPFLFAQLQQSRRVRIIHQTVARARR